MALVLPLPSLWCQKMPGTSPSRPAAVCAFPVPPVISLPLCLQQDCMQTHCRESKYTLEEHGTSRWSVGKRSCHPLCPPRPRHSVGNRRWAKRSEKPFTFRAPAIHSSIPRKSPSSHPTHCGPPPYPFLCYISPRKGVDLFIQRLACLAVPPFLR